MWIVAFLHLVALTLNIFIFLPFLAKGVLEFFIWSDYKHLQAVSLTLNNPNAQSKKKEEFSEDLHYKQFLV